MKIATLVITALFSMSSYGQIDLKGSNASGSGFIVSPDGYIVTNYHVVKDASSIKVHQKNKDAQPAKLLRFDEKNDLAVLKIECVNCQYAATKNSTAIKKGDKVFALGYPDITTQGFESKLTDGIVSSLSGIRDQPTNFQITNPIQHGNSGGPLLDSGGNVVGIISGQLQPSLALAAAGSLPQNVNYAVKSELLMALIKSVPSLSDTLPVLNNSSADLANLTESAVHSIAMILASDASPPYTAKILKDKK